LEPFHTRIGWINTHTPLQLPPIFPRFIECALSNEPSIRGNGTNVLASESSIGRDISRCGALWHGIGDITRLWRGTVSPGTWWRRKGMGVCGRNDVASTGDGWRDGGARCGLRRKRCSTGGRPRSYQDWARRVVVDVTLRIVLQRSNRIRKKVRAGNMENEVKYPPDSIQLCFPAS
jgi:hypothetical protein